MVRPHPPRSTRYGDLFASRAGALAQAEAVFLRGNGLPERWRGRRRFVILETGFGLGNNFLATLDHWRRDPLRSERLFFLSLDAHPVSPEDLSRAHAGSPLLELAQQLQAQWPPRVAGMHRLDFEDGKAQLLLAFGDIAEVLPQWQAEVDAFFLDGFAPRLNPAMWSSDALAPMGRLAAVGASAATWSASRSVRDALQAAGFKPSSVAGFGGKAEMTVAHFVPTRSAPVPPGRLPIAANADEAIVLGAGLAGAACARALRQAGLSVRLIDAVGAATGASGNPAGLFHASVHADDGPHARWSRQAALRCRQWLLRHPPPWWQDGLLRLSPGQTQAERQRLVEAQSLAPQFALALDAAAASQAAGLALDDGGWLFPGGGALPPRDWVLRLLGELPLRQATVAGLQALPGGRWRLLDAQGTVLDETGLLVLAAGARLPALLQPLLPALAQGLQAQRGQLSQWQGEPPRRPALPLAGAGYVLGLPAAAGGGWLAGATTSWDDSETAARPADDAHNAAVAERLLGLPSGSLPPPDAARVAWRLLSPDKLPLIGGLPDLGAPPPPRRAVHAAHWPRLPGLLVCGALASRGIAWAPLGAELLVAQALGHPLPLPRSLVDAVDPARGLAREARLPSQR